MENKKEKVSAFRFKNKKLDWILKNYARILKKPISAYVEDAIIEDLQKEDTINKVRRHSNYALINEIMKLEKSKRKYYRPFSPDV